MATSRPRILLLASDFPPNVGGVAALLRSTYSAIPRGTVTVVAPSRERPYTVEGFKIVTYPARQSWRRREVLTLGRVALRAALRERPDRVHCGSLAETGIVGLGLKLLLRIPLLVHVHGTELWAHRAGPVAQVVRQVLRRADRVVAPSEFTRSRVLAMGVHPTRCEVVLPPVDVRRFPLSDSPIEPRMVVSVGRLVDYKGHDVVLRAIALARRTLPDIEYVIVGDGPSRASLESLAAELDLAGCVRFAGRVGDVRPYLRDCAVFVLPSRTTRTPYQVEGFGIAFAEASASGRPVIGGRSGGVPEAVQEGVTGFLVDPKDPVEVARRIVQLLEDPDLAARLGRQGRDWVARTLDPARAGERILATPDGP